MKKLLLSIITAIILTTVFTACNTQETSETPTVSQSSETVVNKTSSQEEQVQTKEYIGDWKCPTKIGQEEVNMIFSIKDDNTFSIDCDNADLSKFSGHSLVKITGTYIEEDYNKIKLIAKENTYYDSLTEEMNTESATSDDVTYFYFSVKDNNTLIVTDENDETVELIRIN